MNIEQRYHLARKKLPIYWGELVKNDSIDVVWSDDGLGFLLFTNSNDGDEVRVYNVSKSDPEHVIKIDVLNDCLIEQGLEEKLINQIIASSNKNKKIKESSVNISYDNHNNLISYEYLNHTFEYNLLNSQRIYRFDSMPQNKYLHKSPDGTKYAWIEKNNLVYKKINEKNTIKLTSDGIEKYSYGELPFLGKGSTLAKQNGTLFPSAIGWSPSGRYIFCIKLDERNIKELPLIQHIKGDSPARPEVHSLPYSFPGENISTNEIYLFDTQANTMIAHDEKPFTYFGMFHVDFVNSCDQHNFFWAEDEKHFYYLISDRGQYNMTLKKIDIETGKVKEIITESSDTYVDMAPRITDYPAIRPLFKSNQLIWYSEKSGWAHFYMHDLDTGAEKSQITSGEWRVREIIDVDENEEVIYFTAGSRESEFNPYWEGFYKINFDGTALVLLSEENANHIINFKKKSGYFIDQYS